MSMSKFNFLTNNPEFRVEFINKQHVIEIASLCMRSVPDMQLFGQKLYPNSSLCQLVHISVEFRYKILRSAKCENSNIAS